MNEIKKEMLDEKNNSYAEYIKICEEIRNDEIENLKKLDIYKKNKKTKVKRMNQLSKQWIKLTHEISYKQDLLVDMFFRECYPKGFSDEKLSWIKDYISKCLLVDIIEDHYMIILNKDIDKRIQVFNLITNQNISWNSILEVGEKIYMKWEVFKDTMNEDNIDHYYEELITRYFNEILEEMDPNFGDIALNRISHSHLLMFGLKYTDFRANFWTFYF